MNSCSPQFEPLCDLQWNFLFPLFGLLVFFMVGRRLTTALIKEFGEMQSRGLRGEARSSCVPLWGNCCRTKLSNNEPESKYFLTRHPSSEQCERAFTTIPGKKLTTLNCFFFFLSFFSKPLFQVVQQLQKTWISMYLLTLYKEISVRKMNQSQILTTGLCVCVVVEAGSTLLPAGYCPATDLAVSAVIRQRQATAS